MTLSHRQRMAICDSDGYERRGGEEELQLEFGEEDE